MSAQFAHLHASQQELAQLGNEERIAWIRQERWIEYPRAKRILDRLGDLVDYPPRDRMPCLVIYGCTGMGKTRVVQKFLRDNRAHFDKKLGRTRVPVVSIQMPPAPVQRDFYEEILVATGAVFTYGASITTLRHRIRALARQLEVRMLIIDEIHSLLAGAFREQRIILNAVRFLANDLRTPMVCLGTEERLVKIFMRRDCSIGVGRQGVLDSGCHVADRAQAEQGRGRAERCSCLGGCVLRDNALGTG